MGGRSYRPSAAQQEAERLTAEKLKREEAALDADKRRLGQTRNQLVGASGGPAMAAPTKSQAGPGLGKMSKAVRKKRS